LRQTYQTVTLLSKQHANTKLNLAQQVFKTAYILKFFIFGVCVGHF